MHTPTPAARHDAIFLCGPTGSGKTPLGNFSETVGYKGRRCIHFDFGHELRQTVATSSPFPGLSAADINLVRHVLTEGTLLEDHSFHIAEALLRGFIAARTSSPKDIIILNGLPRHLGQLQRLEPIVRIIRTIHLCCSPAIVYERIRRDSGGDRAGRADDAPDAIRRKLVLFEQRTAPLLDDCCRRDIPVVTLDIPLQADPASLWAAAL